jgi:O-antigen ligase
VLLPALTSPILAIGLAASVIAVWLAWKSVAYPLALAGLPTLIDAVVGSNPFPKGVVTLLVALWIGLAMLFAMMRGDHAVTGRAVMSAPVILSLLLLGLMLVRLSASPSEAYGGTKIQLYVADNLVLLLGALFVGSRARDMHLFLLLLLGVTSAGAMMLLFQLVSGSAHAVVETERFSLAAQEYPIALARNGANGLLVAIYAILAARRTSIQLWAVAVLPALVVSMLAAGSRGPVVAFVFGLVALIGLTAATGRARRRLFIVAAGLLVATIIVPLVVPGSAIGRALSAIVGSASGLSTNGRTHLWSQGFNTFAQHPLLGIGTGGFASVSPETYPHNILLEMAAELGALGALVVLAMLGTSLQRLAQAWRGSVGTERLDAAVLIALFLSALVNALFSGAIQDNHEIWIWAGLGVGMSTRLAVRSRLRARAAARGGRPRRARALPVGPGPPGFGRSPRLDAP